MATYSATAHHVTQAISCHAVTISGNLLAICPNTSDVIILERVGGTWQVIQRLEGHDQVVSGLHFSEGGQGVVRLVSSSHDRNSYVWTRGGGSSTSGGGSSKGSSWSPELVITKLSRAGLCVQWSPGGRKFAIGSSEKSVCVCYYDNNKELWAPKLIRKQHDSSVTALAWHPSGLVLATGSTDGRCRLLYATIPEVDGSPTDAFGVLGDSRFGDVLLEMPSNTWVLAVAWSPTGDTLAYCGQDSTLTLVSGLDLGDPSSLSVAAGRNTEGNNNSSSHRLQRLKLPGLPLKCLAFLADGVLVGAGFDFHPLLFQQQRDGQWQLVHLEQGDQQASKPQVAKGGSSLSARIKMFESQVAKPQPAASTSVQTNSKRTDAASSELHSNCIMCVTPLDSTREANADRTFRFITSGLDGKVVEWQLQLP